MEQELTRATVDPKYTWDLTRAFESDEQWEKVFADVKQEAAEFAGFAGRLHEERHIVLAAIRMYMEVNRRLEGLYAYAMMKQNEDGDNGKYQAMYGRVASLASEVAAKAAFFTPELLSLPEEELQGMIADPKFAEYDVFLKGMLRMKPHTLSAREEQLMAMAGEVTRVPDSVADMAYIDLDLGTIKDENGKQVKLTDVRLHSFLLSKNRNVRRNAYTKVMNGYNKFGNTFAALYAGQVKADLFESTARGYGSAREAALYPDEVSEEVYDSLIEAVHGGVDTLNEYLRIRKEQMGLAQLHMYDLYTELESGFDMKLDIEEAFAVFLKAVAPLGADYVADASVALKDRWIDVYETKNKRGGAYCCGSVNWTTPYVLLNHKKTFDGVSTLCHEMGHAMHSYYSNKTQPYAKCDYTIFVAEVASTCNEILLAECLLKEYAHDRQAKIAIVGALLEHFRTTVFRQTMFAEFEQKAHVMAQEGKSLTRDSLNAMYYDLNKLYYGGAVKVDQAVASEWMRIPHFYSAFYVYKYATGFCAAVALARNILSGDPEKIAAYRKFLTLGGSMPPIEELKVAGVDMSTPQPVSEALDYFAELVMTYQTLLREEAQEKAEA